MNRTEKTESIAKMAESVGQAPHAFLIDFQGINVPDVTELRRQVRATGSEYVVVKNTLLERAVKEVGLPVPDSLFTQMTAIGLGKADPSILAKAFYKKPTNKAGEQRFAVKGAIVDGAFFDEGKVERLALLPTRNELIAQVCRGLNSPITGLAMALQQTVSSIVYALDKVREQKAQGTQAA